MKVKVLKNFRDKYTKDLHKKGTEIEITKERYEEINSTAFGVLVKAVNIDLDNMTKKELVEYAKNKDIELDMKMTKKEMIKELV